MITVSATLLRVTDSDSEHSIGSKLTISLIVYEKAVFTTLYLQTA